MIVIIDQACLVIIIIIIISRHTSRRIGLHAAWPTLSVSCNSFGDFPVLPPCFVSLFFLFWSRFEKFWILVKFCCLCVLCQNPLKQKCSAIMSLTNKLSTNWCFLVQQSWQSQVGGRPISPFQEPIRMDWRAPWLLATSPTTNNKYPATWNLSDNPATSCPAMLTNIWTNQVCLAILDGCCSCSKRPP